MKTAIAQPRTLARIEYLKVRNFRALREVEFRELTPLTVLLGPNGSGKSTVFDVFAFLAECFELGLRRAWDKRGRAKELKTRGGDGPVSIEIKYREPGYPLITYHEGFGGRSRIDARFCQEGLMPDIVLSALDADVIKTYVELGLGIGIIAAMAFNPARDVGLRLLDSADLFDPNTTWIAIRKGHFLKNFAYQFIELCNPALKEPVVRAANSRTAGSPPAIQEVFEDGAGI